MQRLILPVEDLNLSVRVLFQNRNKRSSLEDSHWSPAENPADRLKLRLYKSQLTSRSHGTLVVRGVGSVINRDRSSRRARPALYTSLNSWTDTTQWSTAAVHPLTHYHAMFSCSPLTTHSRTEGDTHGPEWRRSLACGLCSTPARCRRPRWASRAGGGTSGWWCRREEGRQGECLCSWHKMGWRVRFTVNIIQTDWEQAATTGSRIT